MEEIPRTFSNGLQEIFLRCGRTTTSVVTGRHDVPPLLPRCHIEKGGNISAYSQCQIRGKPSVDIVIEELSCAQEMHRDVSEPCWPAQKSHISHNYFASVDTLQPLQRLNDHSEPRLPRSHDNGRSCSTEAAGRTLNNALRICSSADLPQFSC